MENVILGFLLIRNMSQYDILKALEKNISPFYQASLGSIQSALRKMVKNELIVKNEDNYKGRKKNIYIITTKGQETFQKYMLSPINRKKIDVDVSTRIFFLGLLKEKYRKKATQGMYNDVKVIIDEYYNFDTNIRATIVPDDFQTMFAFQVQSLKLAIAQLETISHFLRNVLSEIEKESI